MYNPLATNPTLVVTPQIHLQLLQCYSLTLIAILTKFPSVSLS